MTRCIYTPRSILTVTTIAVLVLLAVSAVAATSRLHPHPHPHRVPSHSTHAHSINITTSSCSFNGLPGNCQSVSSCTTGTSIVGLCGGGGDIECCIIQSEPPATGCGTNAVQRGMTWVNMEIQYCQSANGQHDYDPDCSSICTRSVNPEWDQYRSDCSGFVSYAYGYGAPGFVTPDFAPHNYKFSANITYTELQIGDLLSSVPAEHIVIFIRWLDEDYTEMEFIEEPACLTNIPHARTTMSGVVVGDDGLILIEQNLMRFQPIRMNSNNPPC